MKLGIVGAGMIVNDLLQCVHEIDIELTGICATKRNVEHLVQLADEHGFRNWYTDYDEMLANEEIDTVYVAVPEGFAGRQECRHGEAFYFQPQSGG